MTHFTVSRRCIAPFGHKDGRRSRERRVQGPKSVVGTFAATLIDGPLKEAVTSLLFFFFAAAVQCVCPPPMADGDGGRVRERHGSDRSNKKSWLIISAASRRTRRTHSPPARPEETDTQHAVRTALLRKGKEKKRHIFLWQVVAVPFHLQPPAHWQTLSAWWIQYFPITRGILSSEIRQTPKQEEIWKQSRYVSDGPCFSQLGR